MVKKPVIFIAITVVAVFAFWQLVHIDFVLVEPTFENTQITKVINNSYVETLQGHVDSNIRERLSGKTIVFNSWATWCPHCRKEIPYLNKISKRFSQDSNMVFLSNCTDADKDSTKRFLHQQGLSLDYEIIEAQAGLRSSLKRIIARSGGQYDCDTNFDAVPVSFIFDAKGKLRFYQEGGINESDTDKITDVLQSCK